MLRWTVTAVQQKNKKEPNRMAQTAIMEPVCIVPMETTPSKNQAATVILEAIDESLSSLGENAKRAIYSQLQKNYHIKKGEIPFRIDEFVSAIEEIFGDSVILLNAKIMEALYARAKGFLFVPMQLDLSFSEYIHSINCFLEKPI